MEVWMKRGLRGLEPCDEAGLGLLRQIKQGQNVQVKVTKPRNVAFHRKFFALLNLVWSSSGEWPSVEDLLVELKVRLGLVKEVVLRDTGEVVRVPGSISFAKMDDYEFSVFYEKALQELCVMAGGIEVDRLRQEVLTELAAA